MAVVFSGVNAVIRLNNGSNAAAPILFASSVNVTHEMRLEEIPQLDELEVIEYAENGHRCSFSVGIFKLLGNANSADSYSLDPTNLKDILTQPELTCDIMEEFQVVDENGLVSTEERVIYTMQGVKFNGGTGSINARGIWVGTWNFKARRGRGI